MSAMNEKNLDLLWDVNVNVYVRLGSCSLPMKEIVALEPGSVVQLNEKAEDLVGVFVNNKIIARGEVVTVDDHLGIRIKEMLGAQKEEEEKK